MGKINIAALRRRKALFSRRLFLHGAATIGLAPAITACVDSSSGSSSPTGIPGGGTQFLHGVASGDPYSDSVVLWTRVTSESAGPVSVRWEVFADEALSDMVAAGVFTTSSARDYTVKVVAGGLAPHRHYWYRFIAGDQVSGVGRTKTAPSANAELESIRFATTSCALYSFGYFSVYAGVARQDDLDVVFALGDYIYEYGANELEGTALLPDRQMDPPHQTKTLDDYRRRYALYRRDVDLQAAHAKHPWICTWDDHETANNSYDDGAPAHDESVDGAWQDRKRAGIQAYFEWLPVRDEFNPNQGGALYRSFQYGALIEFFVLDTRLQGRELQPERGEASGSDRQMMSVEQENWLINGMRASNAKWKFIPQQTMMAQLDVVPGEPFLPDSWSGYTAQRDRLLDAFGGDDGGTAINNVVVLAGDIHTSFALELAKHYLDPSQYLPGLSGSVGVEFVCPSVTTPLSAPIVTDQAFRAAHPHIRYSEGTSDAGHGYMVFDVNPERLTNDYHYPISILVRTDYERVIGPFKVYDGSPYIDLTSVIESTP
ncbi:MAG: alkaline phosphatase D family protein [Oceanococcus sp.]